MTLEHPASLRIIGTNEVDELRACVAYGCAVGSLMPSMSAATLERLT